MVISLPCRGYPGIPGSPIPRPFPGMRLQSQGSSQGQRDNCQNPFVAGNSLTAFFPLSVPSIRALA